MRQSSHPAKEIARNCVELKSEEILELRKEWLLIRDGNAVGKPKDNRSWDEFDSGAEAGGSHDQEHYPGHHGAHEQAVNTILCDDAGYYNNEGPGRSTDLESRTAEGRDDESSNNGAIDAGLRGEAAGDRKCHRQGEARPGRR